MMEPRTLRAGVFLLYLIFKIKSWIPRQPPGLDWPPAGPRPSAPPLLPHPPRWIPSGVPAWRRPGDGVAEGWEAPTSLPILRVWGKTDGGVVLGCRPLRPIPAYWTAPERARAPGWGLADSLLYPPRQAATSTVIPRVPHPTADRAPPAPLRGGEGPADVKAGPSPASPPSQGLGARGGRPVC